MPLQNLQNELAEALLADADLPDYIQHANNVSIYKNNIAVTLTKTLQQTYPLIVKLLGEDFFATTAREYIQQYPSRNSNLHDYGEYFSHFLSEYSAITDLIYLPEVAQFEWLCHSLYFAADHEAFDLRVLKDIAPANYGELHFLLHPASRVVKFQYPLLRIIDLCKHDCDDDINIGEGGGINLLIIRRELDIKLVPLEPADYVFLNALQDNHSLAVAYKAATLIDDKFNLETKLKSWIQDKTIVNLAE